MKKFKISDGLLALLMFAAMFAGWEYLILVTGFIWVFCDANRETKDLTLKVIAVFGACSISLLLWDLVMQAADVVFGGIRRFFEILVSFGVDSNALYNVNKYFLTPVDLVLQILESVVMFIIPLIKIRFILSVISRKKMGGVFGIVQRYIDKILEFANDNLYEDSTPSTSKAEGKAKFCSKCGAKCDDGAAFCNSCGSKL